MKLEIEKMIKIIDKFNAYIIYINLINFALFINKDIRSLSR